MSTDNTAPGPDSRHREVTRFAADSGAPALARRMLAAAEQWTVPQVVNDATLVVSEVVSNVVRHTDCPSVSVEFEASPSMLHVEVSDCDAERAPQLRVSPPEEPGGLGLHIVSALCSDWGHRRLESGKCVWFDVVADEPEARRADGLDLNAALR